MKSPEERRLAEHFEELRTADRAAAGAFAIPAGEGRRRRARWWIGAAGVAAAGVVIGLRMGTTAPGKGSGGIELATWTSPTAFLLETPGKGFPGGIPGIGVEPVLPRLPRKDGSK